MLRVVVPKIAAQHGKGAADRINVTKKDTSRLFMVAGYPASGKSTLLAHGARGQAEIFGGTFDRTFRKAIGQAEFDERLSTQAKLEKRLWFTLSDVNALEKQAELPDFLVFSPRPAAAPASR